MTSPLYPRRLSYDTDSSSFEPTETLNIYPTPITTSATTTNDDVVRSNSEADQSTNSPSASSRENPTLPRRSQRVHRPSIRFSPTDYVLTTQSTDKTQYRDYLINLTSENTNERCISSAIE